MIPGTLVPGSSGPVFFLGLNLPWLAAAAARRFLTSSPGVQSSLPNFWQGLGLRIASLVLGFLLRLVLNFWQFIQH